MNKINWFLCVILLNIVFTQAIFSQTDTNKHTLKGTVTNAKDKKLSDVTVSILNKKSQEIFRAKSNNSGEYSITAPKGIYKLTANLEGFILFEQDDINLSEKDVEGINITTDGKTFHDR